MQQVAEERTSTGTDDATKERKDDASVIKSERYDRADGRTTRGSHQETFRCGLRHTGRFRTH